MNEKIGERWPIVPQGISAEVIAEEWSLTRDALDAYSLESHRRAVAAIDEGRFEREIVPIEVGAGGALVLFAVDETYQFALNQKLPLRSGSGRKVEASLNRPPRSQRIRLATNSGQSAAFYAVVRNEWPSAHQDQRCLCQGLALSMSASV